MRDDSTMSLFSAIYGLTLGMTLGAVLWTTPAATWRDAAQASCWMSAIESGLAPEAGECPSDRPFAGNEAISVASVAAPAPHPGPSPSPRR